MLTFGGAKLRNSRWFYLMTFFFQVPMFQHQEPLIAGPFSFRVDSGVSIDFKDKSWRIQADQPVFAIEYALHVLCSAKAVAWYSTKHQEFMVELRFFET
ncbi:hypothetical protein V6N13_078921 [Hibiscus sabdariffa]|uniref:Uncharacterized protein n=1 Tax=Hibiscus sabdariffa TaxID=183260 RepID=A0ABR1ZB52_9ROSI